MGLISSAVLRRPGAVRIGCSGWQYKHWRGEFYPAELPQARWFAHYALHFDTVEINNSFYRLPDAATFGTWRDQAPTHFIYAVKASRFLTHMKKLEDPDDPLFRFFDNVKHLGPHLGPILYQLPPKWPLNLERFELFLRALAPTWARATGSDSTAPFPLPPAPYHVVEFREPSWYDDRVFRLLDRYHVALCLHDMPGSATGRMVAGPFIYVRFHFGESKYGGAYNDRRLDEWSAWLTEHATKGLDVFAYFNNDVKGHAPRDAIRLRQRMQKRMAA
jgi:uncharacterized protein YecE (DUF72 family)